MTKWLDPITTAVSDIQRDLTAALAQAQSNWAEVLRLRAEIAKIRAINAEQAERIRRDQQSMAAMKARDDARFARHTTRGGE